MSTTWRTGTVTVTAGSTTVTGVDTAWQTAGIRAGDLFWPSNWARPYEILSIASQTSITLRDAFAGSTASGQAYAIQLSASGTVASEVGAKANAALSSAQDYLVAAAGGKFGDGTAAAPGVAFSTQTNMGLYKSSSSALGLAVSGALAARVDLAGTSAPAAQTVMTREKTDARYLRADTNALALGNIAIQNTFPTFGLIDENHATTNEQRMSVIYDTGALQFRAMASDLSNAVTWGTLSAPGAANAGTTLLTKSKGDALYAPIASTVAIKDDIAPASHPDLSGLQRKSWVWGGALPEDDPRRGKTGSGLIAEDVADVIPDAVARDETGRVIGLDPLTLIGALVAEINALRARVEALEA